MGNKKIKHLKKNRYRIIKLHIKNVVIALSIFLGISIFYDFIRNIEPIYKTNNINISHENANFIKIVKKEAKKNYKKYGIFPSIIIAQAILESGWGKSELTKNSNNLFGIKSDDNWKGESIEVISSENYDDKRKSKFRKYDNINESIKDHAKFLVENNRYKEHGVFSANDYKEQAKSLQNAGYSTKKNSKGELIYASMLIEIIEKYNLYIYDN